MLVVINIKSILSVVTMIPFPFVVGGCPNQYFMVEQIGLDVIETHCHELAFFTFFSLFISQHLHLLSCSSL